MTSLRGKVSNEVLLEKLNNVNERLDRSDARQEKIEVKIDQNFSSLAGVLKEGYVTREEMKRLELDIAALKSEKIDELRMRPYIWVMNTIGALGLTGLIYLMGRLITDYIKGGPPT
jgi:hypothetical protein